MSPLSPLGADPGPIDPKYVEMMNALMHTLDEVFNPGLPRDERKVGFFLAVFDMGEADNAAPPAGRFNYISNAEKLDVRAMLKEIIARIEARMSQGSA